ncbi:DNA-binding transcriptional LysR family regulator [Acidovorax sp. 56]|uniref:LysR family transcriptional regulator n=1 Tax=Acidovorax sp. 56 TaxID=2035205 RepID=UPI000C166D29|nr:LysR family transcriptional regulator [Acidovorax sp. 56]PIF27967.1 DNA-binding transcriptional LysR family regulator [Acidovorax sp. 56]
MQLKWLEDFAVLAQERSFTRAAEIRHVTHPAFGRRIRALEAWAGTPLIERGGGPVRLTAAGQAFVDTAEQMARNLAQSHDELMAIAGRQARTVTLATGRTLARTVVADWLVRLRPHLADGELRILTRALADAVQDLQQGVADFAILYHHLSLTVPLDGRQFLHVALATDRLLPIALADAHGAPRYRLGAGSTAVPYIAFGRTLALGRLVEDLLAHHPQASSLQRLVECDSPDANYEYVRKGLGVSWLPWSMVHGDCKSGLLAPAGDKSLEVKFDVRLYRPKRRLSTLAEVLWSTIARR